MAVRLPKLGAPTRPQDLPAAVVYSGSTACGWEVDLSKQITQNCSNRMPTYQNSFNSTTRELHTRR